MENLYIDNEGHMNENMSQNRCGQIWLNERNISSFFKNGHFLSCLSAIAMDRGRNRRKRSVSGINNVLESSQHFVTVIVSCWKKIIFSPERITHLSLPLLDLLQFFWHFPLCSALLFGRPLGVSLECRTVHPRSSNIFFCPRPRRDSCSSRS